MAQPQRKRNPVSQRRPEPQRRPENRHRPAPPPYQKPSQKQSRPHQSAAIPQRRPGSQREALERYQERLRREEARRERERRIEELREESAALSKGPIDLPFCLLVLLLTAIGLLMLLSASFPSAYYEDGEPLAYFSQQGKYAILGIAVMGLVSKANYLWFRKWGKRLLFVSIILLVLVLIPGNPIALTHKGATRWLGIPGTGKQFQPSEVAKIAVILYFSETIARKKEKMRTFRHGIAPYGILLIVLVVLVGLEPHLSGAILILGTGAALLLVGGINWGWILVAAGGVAGMLYLMLFVVGYNSSRVTAWLDPWQYAQGSGWQLSQSLITIGSGGLLGVGLGKSMQKQLYLPEEHNDFIFPVICEELGLIGATIIMLLFAALILRGYWIALHARNRYGCLLVVGITTQVAVQTFLNIAVVTGLLPTTGISLPFFSYGGTALCVQLLEMGIVLSVSRQMKPPKNE